MTCVERGRFKWQVAAGALLLSAVSAWTQAASPAKGEVSGDYKLSALDVISVTVFQERDLSNEFRVSQDGCISFRPLNSLVKVAGRTPAEVEKEIRERLINEDFMVDPQVTVAVKEYKTRTVAVYGKVIRQGLVKLPAEKPMTIIEAIAEAGGCMETAKQSDIQVSRKGVDKPFTFDLKELKKVTDPKKMFYLKDDDTIYVPERLF